MAYYILSIHCKGEGRSIWTNMETCPRYGIEWKKVRLQILLMQKIVFIHYTI